MAPWNQAHKGHKNANPLFPWGREVLAGLLTHTGKLERRDKRRGLAEIGRRGWRKMAHATNEAMESRAVKCWPPSLVKLEEVLPDGRRRSMPRLV